MYERVEKNILIRRYTCNRENNMKDLHLYLVVVAATAAAAGAARKSLCLRKYTLIEKQKQSEPPESKKRVNIMNKSDR